MAYYEKWIDNTCQFSVIDIVCDTLHITERHKMVSGRYSIHVISTFIFFFAAPAAYSVSLAPAPHVSLRSTPFFRLSRERLHPKQLFILALIFFFTRKASIYGLFSIRGKFFVNFHLHPLIWCANIGA